MAQRFEILRESAGIPTAQLGRHVHREAVERDRVGDHRGGNCRSSSRRSWMCRARVLPVFRLGVDAPKVVDYIIAGCIVGELKAVATMVNRDRRQVLTCLEIS